MTVGVEDGLSRIVDGQVLARGLTGCVVSSATVDGEVGRRVYKRSGLGIRTSVGGAPVGTAEVDLSILVSI